MSARASGKLLRRARGLAALLLALAVSGCGGGPANEVRIPTGARGVGFLPLYVMREHGLVERHAAAAGLEDLSVRWIDIGGPAVMNDALLSGSVHFAAAGPPAFLTLWDRTRGNADVKGVAAIAALPMYLNTRAEHIQTLDDITERDRIAVTAVKVSIPAIVMQMHARRHYGEEEVWRFDRHTVGLSHPDALVALLSGGGEINAHFTSPPFHQRELKHPGIRTVMTTDDVLGGPATFTMLSTTSAFRERNPIVYQAVLAALEEATAMIAADRRAAAELLVATDGGAGLTVEEIREMLEDADIAFTTTPQNVMTYAEFMHEIGSIDERPPSWRELFFPEVHSAPGS
jgi:NitT/TauT family transport system substrate-binding protein